jgi:uncharacterized membrane protein YphA (DoxX/SURF4 family)
MNIIGHDISGYDKANLRILMLSIFCAYFFLRTKFKALLYMAVASFTFFMVFLLIRDVFLPYSGVVGIVMTLIAFAFGKKDWEYITVNGLKSKDLLFSSSYDRFFCIIFLISLLAIGFIH